jgi:hypothetical protein
MEEHMRTTAAIPVLAILLALAAQAQTQPQVSPRLSEVKNLVTLLKSDMATLDFLAHAGTGSEAHASIFNLYADRINALRRQADELETNRKNGTAWQQVAVDRIVPVMKELAASAEAAVRAANSNGNRPGKDYFQLNSDLADELSTVIAAWADYAKTKDDLDRR